MKNIFGISCIFFRKRFAEKRPFPVSELQNRGGGATSLYRPSHLKPHLRGAQGSAGVLVFNAGGKSNASIANSLLPFRIPSIVQSCCV